MRGFLRAKSLSQREFARIASVSHQAVGTWLSGRTIPRGRTLRRLADVIGASSSWLLWGQGMPPSGLPFDEGADFFSQLANASEFISPLMMEYERLLRDNERRSAAVKQKMGKLSSDWRRTVREVFSRTLGKKNLKSKSKGLSVAPMRSSLTLSELLSRARKLTREYGSRQKLARKLKIKPQQLNAWLTGTREPGGDYTLKILAVVQELEAQQKQSGEGVFTTPPTQRTKFSSIGYEKAKSDPKEASSRRRRQAR